MSDTQRTECLFNQTHFLKLPEHPHWNRASSCRSPREPVGCSYTLSCSFKAAEAKSEEEEGLPTPTYCFQSLSDRDLQPVSVRKTGFWVKQSAGHLSCCVCVLCYGRVVQHCIFPVLSWAYWVSGNERAQFKGSVAELWVCSVVISVDEMISERFVFLSVVFSVCICHPVGGSCVRASCSFWFWLLWLHLCPRLWFSAFLWAHMNQTPAWTFDAPSQTCFWSSGFSLFSNQAGMCTYRDQCTLLNANITVQRHSKLLSILH